jgi:hypothetical protein
MIQAVEARAPEVVTSPTAGPSGEVHKKNIYPFVRRIFLVTLVLFVFFILFFLIYHNGKSIYENGL